MLQDYPAAPRFQSGAAGGCPSTDPARPPVTLLRPGSARYFRDGTHCPASLSSQLGSLSLVGRGMSGVSQRAPWRSGSHASVVAFGGGQSPVVTPSFPEE